MKWQSSVVTSDADRVDRSKSASSPTRACGLRKPSTISPSVAPLIDDPRLAGREHEAAVRRRPLLEHAGILPGGHRIEPSTRACRAPRPRASRTAALPPQPVLDRGSTHRRSSHSHLPAGTLSSLILREATCPPGARDGNHAPAVTRITDMVPGGHYSPDVLSTTSQPTSSPASSRPARRGRAASVGHYLIGSRLGGGAQGVVYQATDSRLNRPVALKCLFPHLCDDDCARERFLREAQAGSAVEHPNICVIHECRIHPRGAHLHRHGLLRRSRPSSRSCVRAALSVDDAVEIAAQIAEGLGRGARARRGAPRHQARAT